MRARDKERHQLTLLRFQSKVTETDLITKLYGLPSNARLIDILACFWKNPTKRAKEVLMMRLASAAVTHRFNANPNLYKQILELRNKVAITDPRH